MKCSRNSLLNEEEQLISKPLITHIKEHLLINIRRGVRQILPWFKWTFLTCTKSISLHCRRTTKQRAISIYWTDKRLYSKRFIFTENYWEFLVCNAWRLQYGQQGSSATNSTIPLYLLCESGFSTLVSIKTKSRNKLQGEDDMLCALVITHPWIKCLVAATQAQKS